MKKLHKSLLIQKMQTLTVLLSACLFAMVSVACDNGSDSSSPTTEKNDENVIDLKTTEKLSLDSYSYEVKCAVPDKSGENWTAELTFDEEDDFSGETAFFADFAYIYPTKGTPGGGIKFMCT